MQTTQIVTLIFTSSLFASTAIAEDMDSSNEPFVTAEAHSADNSVNLSPLGILSGSYGLNYERLIGGYHGVLVEANFSRSSDDNASSTALGGTIGYRFHWRGQQNSGFAGLNVGYYRGSGDASVGEGANMKRFDVDTTVSSITVNLGKRWAWESGLNVTFRLGAGKGSYNASTDSKDPDAKAAVALVDDILSFLPVAFDGELSAGYIF